MKHLTRLGTLFLCALAKAIAAAAAASHGVAPQIEGWTASAMEIRMRDGLRLHTIVVAPRASSVPLPIMLVRTPYGVPDDLLSSLPAEVARHLANYGYIRVFQDIRGRHKSEGGFVMLRPPHPAGDIHGVDECTDTYDTIDWLVKKVPDNNGRVGMKGGSYDGWLAAMALIHPHPALKAVCPQAKPFDWVLESNHCACPSGFAADLPFRNGTRDCE